MKQGNAPAMRNRRRQRVLERLVAQLQSGVKIEDNVNVPLTDQDKKRIEKELEALRKRTTSEVIAESTRTKKYRGPR